MNPDCEEQRHNLEDGENVKENRSVGGKIKSDYEGRKGRGLPGTDKKLILNKEEYISET